MYGHLRPCQTVNLMNSNNNTLKYKWKQSNLCPWLTSEKYSFIVIITLCISLTSCDLDFGGLKACWPPHELIRQWFIRGFLSNSASIPILSSQAKTFYYVVCLLWLSFSPFQGVWRSSYGCSRVQTFCQ